MHSLKAATAWIALSFALLWSRHAASAAETTLYQAGFESPTFQAARLTGQNGWTSLAISQPAATIVASGGGQHLQINGSLIDSAGANFFHSHYSRSLGNYNPLGSPRTTIRVRADVWMNLGPTSGAGWMFGFIALADPSGNLFGPIGIGNDGALFGQNFGNPNQVVVASTRPTESFHSVSADYDFTRREVSYRMDGIFFGKIPFNPVAGDRLGNIGFIFQGGQRLDSTFRIDNLTVVATDQPITPNCDIEIISAGPCLADGTAATPRIGDAVYGVKAVIRISGNPSAPFRIKWTFANFTVYSDYMTLPQGEGYWFPIFLPMSLDGTIPWSVSLDPDQVTGDINLANNSAAGTFTPLPPQESVDFYASRAMQGSERYRLDFEPGGTIPELHVLFGMPTTHGAQKAENRVAPAGSQLVITTPNDAPALVIARTQVASGVFEGTNTFVAELSRVRVNADRLRQSRWEDRTEMGPTWSRWLEPDSRVQSSDAAIAEFVRQSLPADYRTALTPYDAARLVHLAVIRKLQYVTPPRHIDAVNVLQDGAADCGGFAALMTACLRHIGIPARCISGFREGNTVWHVRLEFHLQGVEWIVADPTDGDSADPDGNFAYYFGNLDNSDSFVAVSVGDSHRMPYHDFTFLQVPNWWWTGGARFIAFSATAELRPSAALVLTRQQNGLLKLSARSATIGQSARVESTRDFVEWSSRAAVPTTTVDITIDPTRSSEFFRAEVLP